MGARERKEYKESRQLRASCRHPQWWELPPQTEAAREGGLMLQKRFGTGLVPTPPPPLSPLAAAASSCSWRAGVEGCPPDEWAVLTWPAACSRAGVICYRVGRYQDAWRGMPWSGCGDGWSKEVAEGARARFTVRNLVPTGLPLSAWMT